MEHMHTLVMNSLLSEKINILNDATTERIWTTLLNDRLPDGIHAFYSGWALVLVVPGCWVVYERQLDLFAFQHLLDRFLDFCAD
jgi:hypothetical protein